MKSKVLQTLFVVLALGIGGTAAADNHGHRSEMRYDGRYNHGEPAQLIRQVQDKQWKVVWPKLFAAPGVKLIAT